MQKLLFALKDFFLFRKLKKKNFFLCFDCEWTLNKKVKRWKFWAPRFEFKNRIYNQLSKFEFLTKFQILNFWQTFKIWIFNELSKYKFLLTTFLIPPTDGAISLKILDSKSNFLKNFCFLKERNSKPLKNSSLRWEFLRSFISQKQFIFSLFLTAVQSRWQNQSFSSFLCLSLCSNSTQMLTLQMWPWR